MNVYQKLNAARAAFHSLKLKKSGRNDFAKYDYFELGDFLIPALGVMHSAGLCATVSFSSDVATMTIRNVETPEDCIVITSPMGSAALKGCHEVQNIGAVETYQRRYLWVAAMEIVEHDALDATTGSDKPKSKSTAQVTADQTKIDSETAAYIGEVGAAMVADFEAGRELAVLNAWRSITDNDLKVHLWAWLASESKLRSWIKAQQAA